MLYMIIEDLRDNAVPVYRRVRDRGRSLPDGVTYVSSWVTPDFRRCYQVMDADRRELLDEWTQQWSDLVGFEIIPVMTSADAQAAITPQL